MWQLWSVLISIGTISIISTALLPITIYALNNHLIQFLLCLSVGTLIGDAFIHLIKDSSVSLSVIGGIYLFMLFERVLQQYHRGHGHSHVISSLLIFADGLHNFMDGISIGVSFAARTVEGISTSVAILCHEIPHEISDYAILYNSEFSLWRIFKISMVFHVFSLVGGVVGFFVADGMSEYKDHLLGFVGGNFIYLALTDLLPEIQQSVVEDENHHENEDEDHHENERDSLTNHSHHHSKRKLVFQILIQTLGFLSGIGLMYLIQNYLE